MDFAFLIHSRDYTDIQRKFKVAKYLPKSLIEFWCTHWPPILISQINSLKSKKTNKQMKGWVIGVPMTAEQMLADRKSARKKIIQAINKAEKLGAKIIGLGALTSSVTNGGLELLGKINPKITTGNALTAAISIKHIEEILAENNNIEKIAIVGATGSMGSVISKILFKNFPGKEYLIFARTESHANDLVKKLKQISKNTKAKYYINNLENLKNAELIIVTTSAAGAIIKAQHLKPNVIIYDITQPQNIDKDLKKERPDAIIYEGGLVKVEGLEEKMPFGLPPKTIFACLGETMLLALENYPDDFSLGKTRTEKVFYINQLAKKYDFIPSNLKNIKI